MFAFGTRLKALGMYPLVDKLKEKQDKFKAFRVSTGQHSEVLDRVLNTFGVESDHDPRVMKSGQTLFDITSDVLLSIKFVQEERSSLVPVQRNNTTPFTTALVVFFLRVSGGRAGAGLRTGDLCNSWTEEFSLRDVNINFRWCFAQTETSNNDILDDSAECAVMSCAYDPYGDEHAGERTEKVMVRRGLC